MIEFMGWNSQQWAKALKWSGKSAAIGLEDVIDLHMNFRIGNRYSHPGDYPPVGGKVTFEVELDADGLIEDISIRLLPSDTGDNP